MRGAYLFLHGIQSQIETAKNGAGICRSRSADLRMEPAPEGSGLRALPQKARLQIEAPGGDRSRRGSIVFIQMYISIVL